MDGPDRQAELTRGDFFEAAPIGLLRVGADGRVGWANPFFLRLMGHPLPAVVGRHVGEFHADPEVASALLLALAQGESVHNCRALLRQADGTSRPVLIDANGSRRDGRLMDSSWFVRDHTAQAQVEMDILAVAEWQQRRVGRELHDDICQNLAGIQFLSETVAARLAAGCHAEALALESVAHSLREVMDATRRLAHGLSPALLDAEGLTKALDGLATRTEQTFRIACAFRRGGVVPIQDPGAGIHLYRIAQEAVSNALRHGLADRVEIELSCGDDRIVLTVRDNGVGLRDGEPPAGSTGLRLMRYRAGALGGFLVVRPEPPRGTVVVCTVKNGIKPSL